MSRTRRNSPLGGRPVTPTLLDQPPAELVRRWSLATEAGHSRIVCVPGVTVQAIDEFVADLSRAAR